MVRGKEFIPMACPMCNCEIYTVISTKQYNNENYIQSVMCANESCKHSIGLLEPNSIISKLNNIDIVLNRVQGLLNEIKPKLGALEKPSADAVAAQANKNIYPKIPTGTKYNTGTPQQEIPPEEPIGMTGSHPAPAKPNPATDPESSDPEAGQSPE
jgi:hypothetical protein